MSVVGPIADSDTWLKIPLTMGETAWNRST